MALKLPINQKRLTNVAVVRFKSHGKRFEIACYKNKVVNWREGIEKDLEEVLQIDTIFTNVSKGDVANEKDLKKVFGTTDSGEICRKILKDGVVQVSDREREVHLEGLFRDIVQIVVERCVHPQTGRQLTALTVENALRSIGFSVQQDQAAKKQSLKAIEALCTELPESFSRAKMRLRVMCPERLRDEVRRHVVEVAHAQIEEESGGALTLICDPSHFRDIDRHFSAAAYVGEGVSVHIVTAAVLCEGEAVLGGATLAPAPRSAEAAAPRAGATVPLPAAAGAPKNGAQPAQKKSLRCSSCDIAFDDAAEYRSHCRSEWHNFNLKRKVKALPCVSQEEYAEISLDVREGFLAVE